MVHRRFWQEAARHRDRARGKTCHALLLQAVWPGDELIEPASVVFVQTAATTWVRFYVDAGDLGWTVEPELRAIPPYETDSGKIIRCPITDFGTQWGLAGATIERVTFEERQPAPAGLLMLTLRDGRRVALINEADNSRLELLTAAI